MSCAIYLETSVICHLTDPPSPNPITRACQQLTQLWWHHRYTPSMTYASEYVENEISGGDPLRIMQRLKIIGNMTLFPETGMHPNTNESLPHPGVNFDALRQLPPRTRALFVYIHRDDVTY
jgi:hypothetical protein